MGSFNILVREWSEKKSGFLEGSKGALTAVAGGPSIDASKQLHPWRHYTAKHNLLPTILRLPSKSQDYRFWENAKGPGRQRPRTCCENLLGPRGERWGTIRYCYRHLGTGPHHSYGVVSRFHQGHEPEHLCGDHKQSKRRRRSCWFCPPSHGYALRGPTKPTVSNKMPGSSLFSIEWTRAWSN